MDPVNAFTYHPPKNNQPSRYEKIRALAREFAVLIDQSCPDSAERTLAFIKLRESVMWANASIACNE